MAVKWDFHRALLDHQSVGNLFVEPARCDQVQHLALARRQSGEQRLVPLTLVDLRAPFLGMLEHLTEGLHVRPQFQGERSP